MTHHSIRHPVRTGRDVANNLYMQRGTEPQGGPHGDPVIGHICNGDVARDAVEIINREVERRTADPLFPGQTGADLRSFAERCRKASIWSDAQDMPAPDWDGLLAQAADVIEKLSWSVGPDGRVH